MDKLTRKLPDKESFWFYESEGHPIEEKAATLTEFAGKIEDIDSKSLFFHYYRGDFERWIKYSVGDPVLASRLGVSGAIKEGKDLRGFIIKQVKTRLNQVCSVDVELSVKII